MAIDQKSQIQCNSRDGMTYLLKYSLIFIVVLLVIRYEQNVCVYPLLLSDLSMTFTLPLRNFSLLLSIFQRLMRDEQVDRPIVQILVSNLSFLDMRVTPHAFIIQ